MLNLLIISISEAWRTLRANTLRTLLSTLGIVIGVAALISILALGDGMEQYGREQVSSTTDLSMIMVRPKTSEDVDGLRMEKADAVTFGLENAEELNGALGAGAEVLMKCDFKSYLQLQNDTLRKPAALTATVAAYFNEKHVIGYGRLFDAADMSRRDSVIVLNHFLAMRFAPDSNLNALLGKKLLLDKRALTVIGILKARKKENSPQAYTPIYMLQAAELRAYHPEIAIVAKKVEEVSQLKTRTEEWLNDHFAGGKDQFEVYTNDFRVRQLQEVILVFKVVMGLIVGISILVGGIGVMNGR